MEKKHIRELKKNLNKIKGLEPEKNEAILHALVDIKESIEKIYNKILPEIVKEELNGEEIQNLLWDIREEFRHIDYHIHDSEMID